MPRLYGVEDDAETVEGVLLVPEVVEVEGREVTEVPATVVVGVEEVPLLVVEAGGGAAAWLDCPLAANLTK